MLSSSHTPAKRVVALLEYSPKLPVGYTINLLKAAALTNPRIRDHYEIECRMLSAQQFPFEQDENSHTRKDNALLCELMDLHPAVVGFSIFVWNINFFSRFTRMLKLSNPQGKIIWGGKLVTNDWEVLAKDNPDVDCFCVGEGELVFQNYLMSLLENDEPADPLPGTVMRVGGQLRRSPLAAPLADPSSIPSPYVLKLIDPNSVLMANIETFRGCVYHCTFCDWGGKGYRTFSDEYVCETTKSVLEQKFDNIFYMDSVFGMKTARRKKFLKTLLEHYNDHSVFGFEVMLEQLDDEECDLFGKLAERNGLGKIELGIQSTNPETLKIVRRPFHPDRFVNRYNRLVRSARGLQDVLQIDLIIGLPRETWASYGKGLNLLFTLDPGKMSAFPLEIFPGSEMYDLQMGMYGLTALDRPPFSLIRTADMNASEIQKLTVLSWMAIGLRALMRRSIYYLHHLVGEDIFSFLTNFAEWCTANEYVASWHDYGHIEDHAVRLVEYIGCADIQWPSRNHFDKLRQVLLFELAPLMMVQQNPESFQSLWRHPFPNEFATSGEPKRRNSDPSIRQGLFWCDNVICYETHPESNTEALAPNGIPLGLLVEVKEDCYRSTTLCRSEFEDLTSAFHYRDIYMNVASDAIVRHDQAKEDDEIQIVTTS